MKSVEDDEILNGLEEPLVGLEVVVSSIFTAGEELGVPDACGLAVSVRDSVLLLAEGVSVVLLPPPAFINEGQHMNSTS